MIYRISPIAAGLVSILGLWQTAFGETKLEEIVVTAQVREQSLQDVPISITAYSGDYIQEFGYGRLQDLSALVPNVSVTETATGDFISIRGINSGINIGFEQSVGTFIDGVYYGRDVQSRARFLDMERLEVLRGPQSTYFGNNTIGGALSLTTRKPGDVVEGYVKGYWGGADADYDLELALGGPVTETLALRGAAKFNGYEGFLKNQTHGGRKEPDEDSQAYRITGVWTPNDRFDATLKAESSTFEQVGVNKEATDCPPPVMFDGQIPSISCNLVLGGAFTPPFNMPDPTFEDLLDGNSHRGEDGVNDAGVTEGVSTLGDFVDLGMNNYALTMNYDIGEHTLTSITAYNEYSMDRATDIDQFPIAFIIVSDPTEFDQFSQELRLTSPTLGRIEYIAGLYYQSSELETNEVLAVPVGFPYPGGIQQYTLFHQDTKSVSVFGSLTWNISDSLRTTFGGRFTQVDKDTDRRQTWSRIATNPDPSTAPPDFTLDGNILAGTFSHPLLSESRTDSEFTPSVNVQYDLNDNAMLYASYAEGFKAGGYDQRALDGENFTRGFEPENVDSVELGAKTSWLDGKLDVNIAAFYSEYDNLQVSEYRGVGIQFFVRNAASAISKGVELEARWAATDRLTASLAFSYLDAYYDDWANGPCNIFDLLDPPVGVESCSDPEPGENPSKDVSGNVLIYAPKRSGNIGLDYTYPFSNGLHLTTNLTLAYSSEYSTRSDNDPRLYGGRVNDNWDGLTRSDGDIKSKPYTKLDMRIGLGGDRWEVALIGKNINDVKTTNLNNGLPSSSGSRYRTVERERYYLIQASYDF